MMPEPAAWTEDNQGYLMAALAETREALERHASGRVQMGPEASPRGSANRQIETPNPSALEELVARFGLSPFERAILLVCAGIELDAAFAGLCASAQGDPARPYPTFSLALAALPEPHWSALRPDGPLRRWQLIDVLPGPAQTLTAAPLR